MTSVGAAFGTRGLGSGGRVMRDAAQDSGVFLQIGFECRYSLLYSRVKELIDSGTLGRIFQIRRRHCLPFCRNPENASSWHLDPKYNRDIFADDAAHAFGHFSHGRDRRSGRWPGRRADDHSLALARPPLRQPR